MSEDKFLARWSRRKQDAKTLPDVAAPAGDAVPPVPAEAPQPEPFDASSLPSIDSISSATDVTAFLRKGVPGDLTRAALRRAWSSDPVIRDFVGLAENAWDFTDPNAMPGFGPLDYSPEAVRELVSRIVGDVAKTAENLAPESTDVAKPGEPDINPPAATVSTQKVVEEEGTPVATNAAQSAETGDPTAEPEEPKTLAMLRRTHGSALPR